MKKPKALLLVGAALLSATPLAACRQDNYVTVYGPPPEDIEIQTEVQDTEDTLPAEVEEVPDIVDVYGPPPPDEETIDEDELEALEEAVDEIAAVYGPPPPAN